MNDTDTEQDAPRRPSPAALARQIEVQDVQWLMSHKQGRRIAARLLAHAGVYRTSFTGNSESTFFCEGARNEGLWLLNEMTTLAHESYLLMLAENKGTKK